jgi:ubiquitin carboxyl-terminal hydrolase 9/24
MIARTTTVVWKAAVDSLAQANQHLRTSAEARQFVEKYMPMIISILLDQQPHKIGHHERDCVLESLANSVDLIVQDIQIQNERRGKSSLMMTVSHVFGKKKAYYRGLPKSAGWSASHAQGGLPEIRMDLIDLFRQKRGFVLLTQYIMQHQKTLPFAEVFGPFQCFVIGLADWLERSYRSNSDSTPQWEEDAIHVGRALMGWMNQWTDDDLKKVPIEHLNALHQGLVILFDKLVHTRRDATYDFYAFWRGLCLKLITRPSLPLKLYGWDVVNDIIEAVGEHRPPPRAFLVDDAGCTFCNGRYEYAGSVSKDGYAAGNEVSYSRTIPEGEPQAGHKLTIFRCTMRSQQKWWFLSEADEEQPGTDRDIDYYQHKSKEHEEAYPPPAGWLTCRTAGQDPSPTLREDGLMVPSGQEYATLEHELAKWAIENEIVEQVLGDTTIHREVVSRSTSLMQFLAQMKVRQPPDSVQTLQASHLVSAWKTCTRKADAAVAQQVYHLLVSMLPVCPADLGVPLLKAVQESLNESNAHLVEVGDFCAALAAMNNKDITPPKEVREETLTLLWAVLTHPDALSLKSYDSIKRFVTFELSRADGMEHRERFLKTCIQSLTESAESSATSIDEDQALRMVKLTYFLLEACPREQADLVAARDNGSLPRLLFAELVAFFKRKKTSRRNVSPVALQDRLIVLRHVYGLSEPIVGASDPIVMSLDMVKNLWTLCADNLEDREALMVFIASACHTSNLADGHHLIQTKANIAINNKVPNVLSPVFTDEVFRAAFVGILCSPNLDYTRLGQNGYASFEELFVSLRHSPYASLEDKRVALDALWRICLTAANDFVAAKAMTDLLGVYVPPPQTVQDGREEDFGERVFECLNQLKTGMEARTDVARAHQSAQRCLRILNAAIAQQVEGGFSMTRSTLNRLSRLPLTGNLEDAVKCLPHGTRGKAACLCIGVIAKRPQLQPNGMSNQQQPRLPSTNRFALNVHPLETIISVKAKVAAMCQCENLFFVRLVQINGRSTARAADIVSGTQPNYTNLPEDTVMDELGVVHGCETVFLITERATTAAAAGPPARSVRLTYGGDLSRVFFEESKFADQLFGMLLEILALLPGTDPEVLAEANETTASAHQLVWDLLMAMPSNVKLASRVRSACGLGAGGLPPPIAKNDAMDVDAAGADTWSQLLETGHFNRSVYVLLTVDAYLQPSIETMSVLPAGQRAALEEQLRSDSSSFHRAFIDSGGLAAVVRFFSTADDDDCHKSETRRGNAVALRILKCCLYADAGKDMLPAGSHLSPDSTGTDLLHSISYTEGLMKSLTTMVVNDPGISSLTIIDVLRFLGLLFKSEQSASTFVNLPSGMAKRFVVALLSRDEDGDVVRTSSTVTASLQVRTATRDLVLTTPQLANEALSWLVEAVKSVDVRSESSLELFQTIESLIVEGTTTARTRRPTVEELQALAKSTCQKISVCPRPSSESDVLDLSSGVICGCLSIVRALIENFDGSILQQGVGILLQGGIIPRWSSGLQLTSTDVTLLDLMGVMFEGYLTPVESSSVSICFDKESRRHGFSVVAAAAKCTTGGAGFLILVEKVGNLVAVCAPTLRHKWSQFGGGLNSMARSNRGSSKYSGLRNQGCTCYMNSALQQLFMMPELRGSLCAAPLPSKIRTSGVVSASNGPDLVGKRISVQWDSGVYHEAIVEGYDDSSNMHTIRYCPVQVATVSGVHNQVRPEDIARLPPVMQDEFVLSGGRPGKETGVYDIVPELGAANAEATDQPQEGTVTDKVTETKDETDSRHLLEEVQRTFTHLDEGSKGRCFDPRALVEACACLKLEFDVWQQNDASEFVTKLLDRLEVSLKRWAPSHFEHMDHTFGLKQTQQKICKQCLLKTNREEKLLSIDCQIRGKSDIHEALSAMTAADVMEGSNKVFCDRCKEKTDTILRNAISTLPNMLVLSLKRFDLDFNTFETVKLNSRCAFGQTLNMKRYTLEGVEAMEKAEEARGSDPAPMDTDDAENSMATQDPLDGLPSDDYEYRLAGVLVHAGVAQGGHYYSFIRDRTAGGDDKWYRFDDEDVTPFTSAQIETECFGGKVKKETKYPNGQVHTVEQEQFANALMLFYEKVKPTELPQEDATQKPRETFQELLNLPASTGYEVFKPDVRRSNATHQWQSFLFDAELQVFLKNMLDICLSSTREKSTLIAANAWQSKMVSMLVSYLLDVMVYSTDRSYLIDWSNALQEILRNDCRIAQSLVHRLARKVDKVSANWLRTFLLDCPDRGTRDAVARIFAAAVESCSALEEERTGLDAWTLAWKQSIQKLQAVYSEKSETGSFPLSLTGPFQTLEDPALVGRDASAIGILLSSVNAFLDYMPRCWRFSGELCWFVRYLAGIKTPDAGFVMRRPMIESNLPARLIAVAARERAHHSLIQAFPGASISQDVAATQIRAETTHSAHVMTIGGNNQVMGGADMNNSRSPNQFDYLALLEALCAIAGVPGVVHKRTTVEIEDSTRGRGQVHLTEDSCRALAVIFKEKCATNAPGMSQEDIEKYIRWTGLDTAGANAQKIADLIARFPSTESGGNAHLSLEGFFAFYRDMIQTNEVKLLLDLHYAGFRPDLSRRSWQARYDNNRERRPSESVAYDVAESLKAAVDIGKLATDALIQTPFLFSLAFEVSEALGEYLVAATVHMRDPESLINETLMTIHRTPNDWNGTALVTAASHALMVIASMPGDDQASRISLMMLSTKKSPRTNEYGVGLLMVLRYFHRSRQAQHYSNEVHWGYERYLSILKDLENVHPIWVWLHENKDKWNFAERDMHSRVDPSSAQHPQPQPLHHPHYQHQRADIGNRDVDNSLQLDHHSNTDSDMGGMNDSEDEDEASHFETLDPFVSSHGTPKEIIVEGCGTPGVNGVYTPDGVFENAGKYGKDGMWDNRKHRFSIFQCNVSNNTRHWYISIVPVGGNPGTSADVDFFTAPIGPNQSAVNEQVPPAGGWTKAQEGADPPPSLLLRYDEQPMRDQVDERQGQSGQV